MITDSQSQFKFFKFPATQNQNTTVSPQATMKNSQRKYYSVNQLMNSNFLTSNGITYLKPNQKMPFSFLLKERSGKLRWKDVININIDSLVKTNDLTPLEKYLDNLVFASIEDNDRQVVPDSNFTSLIKMFQYILEYLMHYQDQLEIENKEMEMDYNKLVNEAFVKETTLGENKSMLNTLKQEMKEKEMLLMTYKCIVEAYRIKNNPEEAKSVNNESSESDAVYFCQMCSGKKFSTEDNLESHMRRRHLMHMLDVDSTESEKEEPSRDNTNVEKKFEEMRVYLENYLKACKSDEIFNKLCENQINLESKLTEVKCQKAHEIKEMEKMFNSALDEMKECYMSNNINLMNTTRQISHQQQLVQSLIQKPKDNKNENLSILQNQMQKMNQNLMETYNNRNAKITNLMEKMNDFGSTIAGEINQIKIKEKKDSD